MEELPFPVDDPPFCIALGVTQCLSLIKILNTILLTDVANADAYLLTGAFFLTLLALAQKLNVFTRPPPVPLKQLPRRPVLQVLFKPDDVIGAAATTASSSNTGGDESGMDCISLFSDDDPSTWGGSLRSPMTNNLGRENVSTRSGLSSGGGCQQSSLPSKQQQSNRRRSTQQPRKNAMLHGLPDSFAPLLSSSEMEVLTNGLTADLIHAVQVQAQVRLREGRHSIPLDKDERRPQFWFDSKSNGNDISMAGNHAEASPKKGCKVSASVTVGSERFSLDEDLDTTRHTTSRSRPMVKSADLIFDPPLRLGNVAPTLLHFPTLFEDRALPKLRRMQVVGFIIEFLASLWFILEKILWMIERRCQIHLSKVKATPIFRGSVGSDGGTTAQWRLSLSFTGHVLLFDWIPIPFISFQLPAFIIPQPHALLEYLMTKQPLASAKLRRENINDEKIAVAALNALDTWSTNVKAVVTPPAVEVDLTMAGGITLSFEMMHGREVANSPKSATGREPPAPPTMVNGIPREVSNESLASWVTNQHSNTDSVRMRHTSVTVPTSSRIPAKLFDSNSLTPWFLETSIDGSVSKDKIVLNVSRCLGRHEDEYAEIPSRSMFTLSGSVILCRAKENATVSNGCPSPGRPLIKRQLSTTAQNDSPPIHALLLFPETYVPASNRSSLVEYDYAFDIGEETNLDAVSLTYGASHPMLKGGTIISILLESIYAYGSIFAREGSVADPSEKLRKRNILRHLPAVDFTAGIQNSFLPKQKVSYCDDGNTRSIPEMDGGRVMFRVLGGLDESMVSRNSFKSDPIVVKEGIKVIADFGVSSFSSSGETKVNEFPELEIYEGSKLCSFILGTFDGSVTCHLRPQSLVASSSSSGPNVFNPLEAYEIDFSGSSVSLRLKEASFNLDHRRVIVPTETTFAVKVDQSIVNMGFEGTTQCELAWDFQGSSPILQTTPPGQTPAHSKHEDRQQVPLLIKDLCQGRLNLDVSSVGGISFTQASTIREDKVGLYDWKFFNAVVGSPDDDSPARIMDVLHDKRTMYQLLAVTKLINADIERALRYILTKVWRAKEIFDQEGISDPGQAIPGYKLARLVSLFLCEDTSQVDEILPIIRRVVAGNGLDVIKAKELLRKHVEAYDEWAAEIDRGVKWTAVMLGPMSVQQPIEETEVPPLSECIDSNRYDGIPTAKELYEILQDKPQLPLDQSFSSLVSRIAPYLTLTQCRYILHLRPSSHWQPFDLKRLRYVYSIKKKVHEISDSYGGLSFMPQSFFVSVFLGEATRSSLKARNDPNLDNLDLEAAKVETRTSLSILRRRRFGENFHLSEDDVENFIMSPAGRVASKLNLSSLHTHSDRHLSPLPTSSRVKDVLGDSLLGPQDIAVLLQAGLTSAVKGSTVVQLNQRMLLDLMASQPKSFAIAVLAELGNAGPRLLASALMALCDLDQGSFKEAHCINMHNLLESWLPGLKIPRRDDYLAGGRWARQSYYDAVYSVAVSILDLSETYTGLKLRIQQVRHHKERDILPLPLEFSNDFKHQPSSKLMSAIESAIDKISNADDLGHKALDDLLKGRKSSREFTDAIAAYKEAFAACSQVLSIDKLAFQADWYKAFYRRNYDALMVKSIYDNVMGDVDNVRIWMEALRRGSMGIDLTDSGSLNPAHGSMLDRFDCAMANIVSPVPSPKQASVSIITKPFFTCPDKQTEQGLLNGIIDAIFYDESEREYIKCDPLVRLLISNERGHYNFTIISAMGVVTEGKKGLELQQAIERLEKERGVKTVRADTGTARSIEYNATKIEEAVEVAAKLKRPYGLLGYSQGCANEMNFESRMISGTPDQQRVITSDNGLICRQLLFSAANGSMHGPSAEAKVHQLVLMCEDFFKYQQGYFSRAFISSTLEVLNGILDSAAFQKFLGGAKSFFPDALRAFWREAQHLPHIPTSVMRGVLEHHTTPESLEMICNLLSKQSGSALHDSQVHVYDAVGHPVYVKNRNGRILKSTDMGGAIQRTHHWSPLSDEVEFVRTTRDVQQAAFECAKDRHIFPWCDVNARFGIIRYVASSEKGNGSNEAKDDASQEV
mmetsp:Transcript_25806/g.55526  ORF Transcript_25806/g.55526 Transcript_25806/m.55526 type:complete len:2059 (-) Transcript_25806:9-6185(-)|eukprot:CAMPEP_0172322672 /NCGR_PEP_ID=MMETSP1058-20130122/46549_1 /TAXON_ID=83371 /ORGANISM="Detonula confervacea, Strain CCMP 353" /LENGTH=2058 /DNA_ID=CAMNT_0013038479 /DNA_START=101 /DNA_END=6277 /DNA_ORIENTATION=-